MKRKTRTAIISTAITILCLAACGETQDRQETSPESTEMQTADSENQEESDREEGGSVEDTSSTEETPDTEEASDPQNGTGDIQSGKFKTDATIEETVLVDENDIKITATELTYTSYSVKLNLTIENNSDQDLTFHSGTMAYSSNSINGYMMSGGYLSEDVAAGKKAKDSVSFDMQELSIYGITEIADIQIGFSVSDKNYKTIYLEPRQIRTSAADTYDYETDTYRQAISSGILTSLAGSSVDYFAEETLYDQNGVQITSQVLLTSKDGDRLLMLEIENDSADAVVAKASEISINGLLIGSWNLAYERINPGANCVAGISLASLLDVDWWDTYGIASVDEVRMLVSLEDMDNNEIASPQEICISISENPAPVDTSGEELYNENGVRFIAKGLKGDMSDYSEDIHILFLVENGSDRSIYVSDVYNSLSVNGFMADQYFYGVTLPSGRYGIVDVELSERTFENIDITGIEDISEIEIGFEIMDEDYDTLAEPQLFIQY